MRFRSGIRLVIALGAGLGGVSLGRVAACGLVSMVAWNGLLFYAGLLVGQNWEQVTGLLAQYNRILLALLALLGAGLGGRWWRARAAERS